MWCPSGGASLYQHVLDWWKPLVNGADVISPGDVEPTWIGLTGAFCTCCTCPADGNRLELSWIVPRQVPSVLVAHAWLMKTAGKRSWCWLPGRLGTQLDCSLSCRCLPVPAAHARLMVGRGMRLSGVCWSMDGAWPALGSGAHLDLLIASMKSNFEPLWKRQGNYRLIFSRLCERKTFLFREIN